METFAPKKSTITAVKLWLLSEGISEERIKLSVGRNWLRINLTIYEAESLLKTEYKVFEDGVTGKRALACDMYSIPSDLRQHIDFITPTISPLSLQARRAKRGVNKASHHFFKQEPASGLPGLRPLPQLPTPPRNNANSLSKRDSGASTLVWDLSVCPAYITRACIQALYNMPNGTLNA
jgi:tripeptidyl-peptidase-1